MFVRRFSPLQTAAAAERLGVPYPQIEYGQTAGERNIIAKRIVRVWKICLPIKIYPSRRRMKASSASRKDYRLVDLSVRRFIRRLVNAD